MLSGAQVPCLLCHSALGGEAFYRVVGTDRAWVEVEVVSAPGLRPGMRVRFTAEAVAQMAVVEADDARGVRGGRGESSPPAQDGRVGDAVARFGG